MRNRLYDANQAEREAGSMLPRQPSGGFRDASSMIGRSVVRKPASLNTFSTRWRRSGDGVLAPSETSLEVMPSVKKGKEMDTEFAPRPTRYSACLRAWFSMNVPERFFFSSSQ